MLPNDSCFSAISGTDLIHEPYVSLSLVHNPQELPPVTGQSLSVDEDAQPGGESGRPTHTGLCRKVEREKKGWRMVLETRWGTNSSFYQAEGRMRLALTQGTFLTSASISIRDWLLQISFLQHFV
jgi:hypothetical protein